MLEAVPEGICSEDCIPTPPANSSALRSEDMQRNRGAHRHRHTHNHTGTSRSQTHVTAISMARCSCGGCL